MTTLFTEYERTSPLVGAKPVILRGLQDGLPAVPLTGFLSLRRLASPCIRAPETQTHLVQEFHFGICHALCLALEETFFGSRKIRRPVAARPRSIPARSP